MIRKGAGAIVACDDKILLVEKVMLMHAKGGPVGIDPEWGIPKGGVNPGENILDAIGRELYEESGIEGVRFIRMLPAYDEPFSESRQLLLGFDGQENQMALFSYHDDTVSLIPRDMEIRSARFFTLDEAYILVSSSLGDYIKNNEHLIFGNSIK